MLWHPEKMDDFREELTKRIRRRLVVLAPSNETQQMIWDTEWLDENRKKAKDGLTKIGRAGFVEVRHALIGSKIQFNQKDLLVASDQAQIHTFGWPIGIVPINSRNRPRPIANGIVLELFSTFNTYDYWALRKNGDFYLLASLFEDDGSEKDKAIFFDTRIIRTAEILLHCARLYNNLKAPPSAELAIAVKYSGLKNRVLSSSSRDRIMSFYQNREENQIEIEERFKLSSIDIELTNNVKRLTTPLFALFDFFKPADSVYEDIVNKFVNELTT